MRNTKRVRKTSFTRKNTKPQARPLEDRYGAVPVELAGLDPEELPAGARAQQISAHGPDGDAAITLDGADGEGLRLEPEPAADEDLTEFERR